MLSFISYNLECTSSISSALLVLRWRCDYWQPFIITLLVCGFLSQISKSSVIYFSPRISSDSCEISYFFMLIEIVWFFSHLPSDRQISETILNLPPRFAPYWKDSLYFNIQENCIGAIQLFRVHVFCCCSLETAFDGDFNPEFAHYTSSPFRRHLGFRFFSIRARSLDSLEFTL